MKIKKERKLQRLKDYDYSQPKSINDKTINLPGKIYGAV
jgi:hypothetical protein